MKAPDLTSPRDRILEGACDLFARYGFQAIGLRDLAEHVGIKPGSLYHHIDSKQLLLYELMEDAISELLYCTRLNIKGQRPAHERLDGFIDTFMAFKRCTPSRTHLLSREQINLTHDQAREFNVLKSQYVQILSDIISDVVKVEASSARNLTVAAEVVIGMLFNQGQWVSVTGDHGQYIRAVKRFALGIIAAIDSETALMSTRALAARIPSCQIPLNQL